MKIIPVPTTRQHLDFAEREWGWTRFLPLIAKRAREPVSHLLNEVLTGNVQVHVIVDDEGKSKALVGTQTTARNGQLIGEMVWCSGTDRSLWFGLLGDLERYFKDHLGCVGMKAVCRPGWSKPLKKDGYRMTHVVMEKDF